MLLLHGETDVPPLGSVGYFQPCMESHSALGTPESSPRFFCVFEGDGSITLTKSSVRVLAVSTVSHGCHMENSFGMGTWAQSPNHTFPRWQDVWCQAFSLSAEIKPLPVTQPYTNQTTATGLLSFNTCLSKYIWGLLFSDTSIRTLGIFLSIYLLGK